MTANPMRYFLQGGAVFALAGLASFPVAAAEAKAAGTAYDTAGAAPPVVVAQASNPVDIAPRLAVRNDGYPPDQRGVREAAGQGNEALRRYIWRTRMIYNFLYRDFALE